MLHPSSKWCRRLEKYGKSVLKEPYLWWVSLQRSWEMAENKLWYILLHQANTDQEINTYTGEGEKRKEEKRGLLLLLLYKLLGFHPSHLVSRNSRVWYEVILHCASEIQFGKAHQIARCLTSYIYPLQNTGMKSIFSIRRPPGFISLSTLQQNRRLRGPSVLPRTLKPLRRYHVTRNNMDEYEGQKHVHPKRIVLCCDGTWMDR